MLRCCVVQCRLQRVSAVIQHQSAQLRMQQEDWREDPPFLIPGHMALKHPCLYHTGLFIYLLIIIYMQLFGDLVELLLKVISRKFFITWRRSANCLQHIRKTSRNKANILQAVLSYKTQICAYLVKIWAYVGRSSNNPLMVVGFPHTMPSSLSCHQFSHALFFAVQHGRFVSISKSYSLNLNRSLAYETIYQQPFHLLSWRSSQHKTFSTLCNGNYLCGMRLWCGGRILPCGMQWKLVFSEIFSNTDHLMSARKWQGETADSLGLSSHYITDHIQFM